MRFLLAFALRIGTHRRRLARTTAVANTTEAALLIGIGVLLHVLGAITQAVTVNTRATAQRRGWELTARFAVTGTAAKTRAVALVFGILTLGNDRTGTFSTRKVAAVAGLGAACDAANTLNAEPVATVQTVRALFTWIFFTVALALVAVRFHVAVLIGLTAGATDLAVTQKW